MPKKYQPDYPYLRKVPIARVHMFTMVQLGCLIMLWVVKDIKQTSIFFPVMVILMDYQIFQPFLKIKYSV